MEFFWITFQIMIGILSPVFLLFIVINFRKVMELLIRRKEFDIESKKKEPPFDDHAEFYDVPNPAMIGVKLYKNKQVIWDGGIYKRT